MPTTQKFYKGQLVKLTDGRIGQIQELDTDAAVVYLLDSDGKPNSNLARIRHFEFIIPLTISPAEMKAKIQKAGRAVRFGEVFRGCWSEPYYDLTRIDAIQDDTENTHYETTDSLSISLEEESHITDISKVESAQPTAQEVDLSKIQIGDRIFAELVVDSLSEDGGIYYLSANQSHFDYIAQSQIKAHFPAKSELEEAEENLKEAERSIYLYTEMSECDDIDDRLDRFYEARRRVEELQAIAAQKTNEQESFRKLESTYNKVMSEQESNNK